MAPTYIKSAPRRGKYAGPPSQALNPFENIRRDSPILVQGPHVELEGPGPTWLFVKKNEAVDDALDADQSVLPAGRVGETLSYLFTADRTIDHHMADMDTVACVLLRHRLRQRAKSGLGRIERAVARTSPERRARPREQQRS